MGFLDVLFGNKNRMSVEEMNNLINEKKDILILDVRSIGEFRSGHIPKAKNIPVQELNTKVNTLNSYKDKEIIVYCASGGRSASATSLLSKNGFTKVYNLGGIRNYKGKLK